MILFLWVQSKKKNAEYTLMTQDQKVGSHSFYVSI